MKTEQEALSQMEEILESARIGKGYEKPDISDYPEYLIPLAEKLFLFVSDVYEGLDFAREFARGILDQDPPSRRNYLSAPMKEIHSQLTSFCWSIQQLLKGNMVSKLNYPGELYTCYNDLVEKVSQTFGMIDDNAKPEWGGTVTSWRYHQILSAINQLRTMVIELNPDGTILFANPPVRQAYPSLKKLPYGEEENNEDYLINYLCTFANRSGINNPLDFFGDEFPIIKELYITEKDLWYKVTTDRVKLTDGSVGMLHMIDDITEWKKKERNLKISADTDPLTSAYTRRAGFEKLEELVNKRFIQDTCVAFLDVDGLKGINDKYGHTDGDFVIKTTAELLMSSVRDSDWVIRFGGDEFIIVFQKCVESMANEVFARMYKKLDGINASSGKPYKISFSIGIIQITPEMEKVQDVVDAVDRIMYENKFKKKLSD